MNKSAAVAAACIISGGEDSDERNLSFVSAILSLSKLIFLQNE